MTATYPGFGLRPHQPGVGRSFQIINLLKMTVWTASARLSFPNMGLSAAGCCRQAYKGGRGSLGHPGEFPSGRKKGGPAESPRTGILDIAIAFFKSDCSCWNGPTSRVATHDKFKVWIPSAVIKKRRFPPDNRT
jgi:hypothetical protein